jgi:hypothetical protein
MINLTVIQPIGSRQVKSITLSGEDEQDYEVLNKVFMSLLAGNVKDIKVIDQNTNTTEE